MSDKMVERAARAYYGVLTAHAAVLQPGAPFKAWDELPDAFCTDLADTPKKFRKCLLWCQAQQGE